MLTATINCTKNDGSESIIYLDIVNTRGRRISDYQVKLYGADNSTFQTDCLLHYPRWSESSLGLVARGLSILNQENDTLIYENTSNSGIAHFKISLKLISGVRNYQREIESIQFNSSGSTRFLEHYSEMKLMASIPFALTDEDKNPSALAIRAICTAIFGTNSLLPYPEVFNPPVHSLDNIKYVRLNEIPEPIRTAFSERLGGATVPMISNEHRDNVAFSWDWDAFVGN